MTVTASAIGERNMAVADNDVIEQPHADNLARLT